MARTLRAIVVVTTMLLAGCQGDDGAEDDGGETATGTGEGGAPSELEPLTFTGTVTGLPNAVGGCDPPVECPRFPFTVPAEGHSYQVDITLTWQTEGMDLDLFLYAEGTEVASSDEINPPGTSESLTGRIGPGDFEVEVDGYLAADEAFQVDVTFSDPKPIER